MNFRDFFYLREVEDVEWGYFGDLKNHMGGGLSERLNYGSALEFGPRPMLYVPIKRRESELAGVLGAARRAMARKGIRCVPDPTDRISGGWRCGPDPIGHKADLKHTGEQHLTVAYHSQLQPIYQQKLNRPDISLHDELQVLSNVHLKSGEPLFDGQGVGVEMPIKINPKTSIIYGIARLFKGQPLVVLLPVECPRAVEVRDALGLPPPLSCYRFNNTIGYAFGKWTDREITTDPKAAGVDTGSA